MCTSTHKTYSGSEVVFYCSVWHFAMPILILFDNQSFMHLLAVVSRVRLITMLKCPPITTGIRSPTSTSVLVRVLYSRAPWTVGSSIAAWHIDFLNSSLLTCIQSTIIMKVVQCTCFVQKKKRCRTLSFQICSYYSNFQPSMFLEDIEIPPFPAWLFCCTQEYCSIMYMYTTGTVTVGCGIMGVHVTCMCYGHHRRTV